MTDRPQCSGGRPGVTAVRRYSSSVRPTPGPQWAAPAGADGEACCGSAASHARTGGRHEPQRWSFDPHFTDQTAACMLVGERASVMLLTREKFAQLSKLPMADPATHALALYCFGVSSREEVDAVTQAALAAGGMEADALQDYGFMCSRSFFDLDGHGWQVMWMNPAAAQLGPEELATSMQDADAPA